MQKTRYDAVIVGSGPNGLAAALTLAQAGRSVLVIESKETIGGGTRTAELTLPGFLHDVCSAIHPLALASPFFRTLPLGQYGLEWIQPPAALAHPFDDGPPALLERSIEDTGHTLGSDASRYAGVMEPLASRWEDLLEDILGPLPLPPRSPFLLARFGLRAIFPARRFAELAFEGWRARGFFAGMAAHAIMSLEKPISTAFGLMMGALGHAVGWPLAKGGSQRVAEALGAHLRSMGGEIVTGWTVKSVKELPPSGVTLFDVTPHQLLSIAGECFPEGYRRKLRRYRYGPGVFKLDYALAGPIPWKSPQVQRAATVHLGGTLPEIASAEQAAWEGRPPERPFVILSQQSLFDPGRAPDGKHTAWAYCHVPNGSPVDMTERIERQIERFAPGFRDLILQRSVMPPAALQAYNPNYIGGDINGGVQDLGQLFTRPVARWVPYSTPAQGIYLCSSSTPPGGGVHGMCGYQAARAALREALRD